MIENAIAAFAGGVLLAWGIARSVDRVSPSLKTRSKRAWVVEDPDQPGYVTVYERDLPDCPNTPDALLAFIDREPAGK